MVREVDALSRLLGEPERPFAALLGGAKIEGKIDTLENLLPRLDLLLVGGGLANTFLAAQGLDLADSLVERERLDMAREVEALGRLLGEPERPFAALLGGAKVEGKIDTLENLLPRLDLLLLGGGMANTFLAAEGYELGASLFEPDRLDLAREILSRAKARGTEVLLPRDLVVTDNLDAPGRIETVPADRVPRGMKAVDVGPETCLAFAAAVGRARTLFWNGPLGVFEKPPFDEGTRAVAQALAACPGFSVIGGGETVAAAKAAGVADKIGHVSTGGGASLEFLAGKTLPGVAVLEKGK
jgi:phosphoglycerate kinase